MPALQQGCRAPANTDFGASPPPATPASNHHHQRVSPSSLRLVLVVVAIAATCLPAASCAGLVRDKRQGLRRRGDVGAPGAEGAPPQGAPMRRPSQRAMEPLRSVAGSAAQSARARRGRLTQSAGAARQLGAKDDPQPPPGASPLAGPSPPTPTSPVKGKKGRPPPAPVPAQQDYAHCTIDGYLYFPGAYSARGALRAVSSGADWSKDGFRQTLANACTADARCTAFTDPNELKRNLLPYKQWTWAVLDDTGCRGLYVKGSAAKAKGLSYDWASIMQQRDVSGSMTNASDCEYFVPGFVFHPFAFFDPGPVQYAYGTVLDDAVRADPAVLAATCYLDQQCQAFDTDGDLYGQAVVVAQSASLSAPPNATAQPTTQPRCSGTFIRAPTAASAGCGGNRSDAFALYPGYELAGADDGLVPSVSPSSPGSQSQQQQPGSPPPPPQPQCDLQQLLASCWSQNQPGVLKAGGGARCTAVSYPGCARQNGTAGSSPVWDDYEDGGVDLDGAAANVTRCSGVYVALSYAPPAGPASTSSHTQEFRSSNTSTLKLFGVRVPLPPAAIITADGAAAASTNATAQQQQQQACSGFECRTLATLNLTLKGTVTLPPTSAAKAAGRRLSQAAPSPPPSNSTVPLPYAVITIIISTIDGLQQIVTWEPLAPAASGAVVSKKSFSGLPLTSSSDNITITAVDQPGYKTSDASLISSASIRNPILPSPPPPSVVTAPGTGTTPGPSSPGVAVPPTNGGRPLPPPPPWGEPGPGGSQRPPPPGSGGGGTASPLPPPGGGSRTSPVASPEPPEPDQGAKAGIPTAAFVSGAVGLVIAGLAAFLTVWLVKRRAALRQRQQQQQLRLRKEDKPWDHNDNITIMENDGHPMAFMGGGNGRDQDDDGGDDDEAVRVLAAASRASSWRGAAAAFDAYPAAAAAAAFGADELAALRRSSNNSLTSSRPKSLMLPSRLSNMPTTMPSMPSTATASPSAAQAGAAALGGPYRNQSVLRLSTPNQATPQEQDEGLTPGGRALGREPHSGSGPQRFVSMRTLSLSAPGSGLANNTSAPLVAAADGGDMDDGDDDAELHGERSTGGGGGQAASAGSVSLGGGLSGRPAASSSAASLAHRDSGFSADGEVSEHAGPSATAGRRHSSKANAHQAWADGAYGAYGGAAAAGSGESSSGSGVPEDKRSRAVRVEIMEIGQDSDEVIDLEAEVAPGGRRRGGRIKRRPTPARAEWAQKAQLIKQLQREEDEAEEEEDRRAAAAAAAAMANEPPVVTERRGSSVFAAMANAVRGLGKSLSARQRTAPSVISTAGLQLRPRSPTQVLPVTSPMPMTPLPVQRLVVASNRHPHQQHVGKGYAASPHGARPSSAQLDVCSVTSSSIGGVLSPTAYGGGAGRGMVAHALQVRPTQGLGGAYGEQYGASRAGSSPYGRRSSTSAITTTARVHLQGDDSTARQNSKAFDEAVFGAGAGGSGYGGGSSTALALGLPKSPAAAVGTAGNSQTLQGVLYGSAGSMLSPLPESLGMSSTCRPITPAARSGESGSAAPNPLLQVLLGELSPSDGFDITIQFEDLTIKAVIGKGAFGEVYHAVWRGQDVAVKQLVESPQLQGAAQSPELKSFIQEIAILSRARHENIVHCFGGCLQPPKFLIVEELLCCSLHDFIYHPHADRDLLKLLYLMQDVAMGLAYLHPTVIHRDLKPANVLLDLNGRAKITDFGLARYKLRSKLSTRTMEAGTTPYLAPECFDHAVKHLSDRSDVYSLGMIMWEVITRQQPWHGMRDVAIAYNVHVNRARPPLPPSDWCPPRLQKLIRACWAQKPRDRPSAPEVVKQLTLTIAQLELQQKREAVTGQQQPWQ